MNQVAGARGLFYVRAVALGWNLLSTVLWAVLPRLSGNFEVWFRISAISWLLLEVAELAVAVPFAGGRRGTSAETPARALLMLLTVSLGISLVQSLPELGGPALFKNDSSQVFYLAERLLFAAGEVALWLAITRSLAAPTSLTPAFYGLLAFSMALSSLQLVMKHGAFFELIRNPLWHWARLAISVALQAVMLVALKQLMDAGGAQASAAAQTAPGTPAVTPPGRDILVGGLWLGGGVLITLLSYSAASSAGGGRYVVTTGAIAYGLVRLVRGFVRLGG